MRQLIPILILALSGCASVWKGTYTGGAVTSQLVTDAHRIGWTKPLRERAEECDAKLDPETHTVADFDACTEPYTEAKAQQVLGALKVYNAATEVLEQVLLATDPSKPDKKALIQAWAGVYAAALDLLELLPEGDKYRDQLELLTKGLVR